MEKAFEYLNQYIEDGSIIGMGSGTTIEKYIPVMKDHIDRQDLSVEFLSTSLKTEKALQNLGLTVIHDAERVDAAIDGADQFTGNCLAVKGGGGSLMREKQVDYFAGRLILVAHERKKVEDFGGVEIPVEINQYLYRMTGRLLEATGAATQMRMAGGGLFVTDNGNYIVDCTYRTVDDPGELHQELVNIPGVVETGIFDRHIKEIVSFNEQGFKTYD
ncbi:hypothetical protein WN59_12650 [Salinicoccus sediminis]|uniref:Ribose 5-phosphate isomerase A n=1 Tax=Salinicoccus sediminis TaxID=1432562 RepID=A0A0M2SDV0_9STAP|nr:ribose 5-phosphate isomerase A [Salinicoccus sediminis]KKK32894.1 hypothetical protein WN59_12650 [Salinicoccus sediminis]